MLKKNKGSFTVEATLIFPTIFFSLLAGMYIIFVLYEQVYLQTLADETVEKGALCCEKTSLYMMNSDKIKMIIEQYINENADESLFIKNISVEPIKVKVCIENEILYKKIKVEIRKSYLTPIGFLNKFMGIGNKELTVTAKAEFNMSEETELIRNVDFIEDSSEDIPGVSTLKESYSDILEDVKYKIEHLLE